MYFLVMKMNFPVQKTETQVIIEESQINIENYLSSIFSSRFDSYELTVEVSRVSTVRESKALKYI